MLVFNSKTEKNESVLITARKLCFKALWRFVKIKLIAKNNRFFDKKFS